MNEVTIRDLRNRGADVLDRVVRGETLTVTRDGRPIAELRPIARTPLRRSVLLRRWRGLPPVDPVAMRTDLDELIDPSA
jgi:prevent-host-death family protein